MTAPARPSRRQRTDAARARAAVTLPPVTYPANLPVSARRDDIAAAIRDHQVVIVAGETGSGKTTQIPKILLELGKGRAGQIAHTQPRRIAARSVATRIAEELDTGLGDIVGYQVRFTDQSSSSTLVKVMTDGILLTQIQRDPQLLAYDAIIIDEAHERSLNIDFLLGYLTTLLPQRPDLRLVITSATIDAQRFAHHFAPGGPLPFDPASPTDDAALAPIISVTGRTYPVEVRYRPLTGASPEDDRDQITGIVDACDELMADGPGDILVFLSGEREIRDAADALAAHLRVRATDRRHPHAVELLPLYSRLSAAEQHRVFEPHGTRRIVLATNVAETSLTVPGIHYVVDPGTARISRYSKSTKVQRLPIEPISQASANQRSGRAGRLADGIAIRLYSEEDFDGRPAYTEPEILRTSLASVLLQMISVRVVADADDMARFPFVEPPDTRAIRDGVNLLRELGALRGGAGTELTHIGRTIAQLPIDPRQARMIVEAERHGVAAEVAVIAAGLSIQDPRERPADGRDAADIMHRRFADPTSDLLAYLNLWEYLREQRKELSGSAFRRLCRAEHLNFLRVREWQDVVQQIRQTARPAGISIGRVAGQRLDDERLPAGAIRHRWNEDAIHRSVLAGLLSQMGVQDAGEVKASSVAHLRGDAREAALRRARKGVRNEYLGARGARFAIMPGSPLARRPPSFVMAAQLVETSRLWARDVAVVDPAWAEQLAGDLAKRSYSEPHWSSRQGAAMATERVTVYGVPVVSGRSVMWGRIAPEEAREMFIRHALVEGQWRTHHEFYATNQRLWEEAEALEARARTRGLVVDEDTVFDFYDERIPDDVISARHFDRWWKTARRRHPDLLTMSLETVVPDLDQIDTSQFPHVWPQGDLELAVTYRLEPGSDDDGVTVHIPVELLPQVVPDGFDWLVPGLAEELAVGTIRALPKSVRRALVPAPDTARDVAAFLAEHTPAWADVARAGDMAESYRSAFSGAVAAVRSVQIPDEAWDGVEERLPSHLRITFVVEDGHDMVGRSASLPQLQRTLAGSARAAVAAAVTTGPGASAPQIDMSRTPARTDSAADGRFAVRTAGTSQRGAYEQEALTGWPDLPGDALPDHLTVEVAGATVRGYPSLVDEGDSASLRVLASDVERSRMHPAGVRRLLLTECALPAARITTRWTSQQSLDLAASPYPTTDALVTDLQRAAIHALTADDAGVRDRAGYHQVRDRVQRALEDEVHRLAGLAAEALAAHRHLQSAIAEHTSMALLKTLQEVREQAAALIFDGFVRATPVERLNDLPRYLRAATARLDRAQDNPARDATLAWSVAELEEELAAARSSQEHEHEEQFIRVRWLIEELRVSLFAQQLGTSEPVSAKRIRALLR